MNILSLGLCFVFLSANANAQAPDRKGGAKPRRESAAAVAAAPVQYRIEVEVNRLERINGKDGNYPWEDAMAYCQNIASRLPTAEELKRAYAAECPDGRRTDTCRRWYWSSQEENGAMAFGMRFFDGDMHSGSKYSTATGMLCLRNQDAAAAYCRLNKERLPTAKELRRIYAAECPKKRRTENCSSWYWAAKGAAGGAAYGLNFYDGVFGKLNAGAATSAIACVPAPEKPEK
jgi:hypothetical protein